MRKIFENPDGKLRTVQGVMAETNLSRNTVMRIAEKANAVVRFGSRVVRIDIDCFYAYLRKGAN